MNSEQTRCLLCENPPCSSACPKGMNPGKGIFSLRFDNKHNAGVWFNSESCSDCDAPCVKACVLKNHPIDIPAIGKTLQKREKVAERDLSITFCGLKAENPFFLGSAVEASGYEMIAKAFRLGWAGVVYKTISFMTIHEVSPRFDVVPSENDTFVGFRNMEQLSEHTPEEDLAIITRLKKEFPTKIVCVSIMGRSCDEWTELARMSEEAGADIIECNFSCPQMTEKGTGSDVGQSPELVREYTAAARKGTTRPLLAKMTPNITHMEEPAKAALEGGADGIAAINTIKSVTLGYDSEVCGHLTISGYSGKAVKPIAQRFILEMSVCPETSATQFSGIGGIETWRDGLEYLLLGCRNVQVVTSVMQYGYRLIDDMKSGLADYLDRHNEPSVEAMVGRAIKHYCPADQLNRQTYVMPRFDREKCVGCGRCFIACADGGHQAITFDAVTRQPHIDGHRCVGCQLCYYVCPEKAILRTKRIEKK